MARLKVGDKLECLISRYDHFNVGDVYKITGVDRVQGSGECRYHIEGVGSGPWWLSTNPDNTDTFYPTFKKTNGKWWKESA